MFGRCACREGCFSLFFIVHDELHSVTLLKHKGRFKSIQQEERTEETRPVRIPDAIKTTYFLERKLRVLVNLSRNTSGFLPC